jgi:hypothetical protein
VHCGAICSSASQIEPTRSEHSRVRVVWDNGPSPPCPQRAFHIAAAAAPRSRLGAGGSRLSHSSCGKLLVVITISSAKKPHDSSQEPLGNCLWKAVSSDCTGADFKTERQGWLACSRFFPLGAGGRSPDNGGDFPAVGHFHADTDDARPRAVCECNIASHPCGHPGEVGDPYPT